VECEKGMGREGGDEIGTIEGGCNSELVPEGRVARGRVDDEISESRFEETEALKLVIKFRWTCCVHRQNDLERTEFYILCLI
jgi:hypothetical protein